MRVIFLIALREYLENVRTKGFWLGVLLFPVILLAGFLFSQKLATSVPARHYLLIDQSGRYQDAVQTAIMREHQRRILQEFVDYLQEYRREPADIHFEQRSASAPQVDQLVDDFANDEVAALDQWLENGGLNVALAMAGVSLKPDAPPFEEPREQFVEAPLPEEVDPTAEPAIIIEQLRPYLTGDRQLDTPAGAASLFAVILIPPEVEDYIVRPGAQLAGGSSGIEYWASNLTDSRLPNAIQASINDAIRVAEYQARGIDVQAVREVQRTRLPVNRLDPKKAAGQEGVSMADTFQQWAPVGFVYLMFISLMQSVQYLLSNTIEEKANRIIEVLLASVTPGELMMGKLLGIAISGITTIAAWLLSFVLFMQIYQTSETELAAEILKVLLASDLIPYFIFYYLAGYALYSGIFLAIGSLCNTLKEAQSLMMPMMMILIAPLITMSFIAQDPNGPVARIMSWVPLFTPFTMMNRAGAQPPMTDVIGTTLLLLATIALVLWLSGKIFRQGVLRTGQPPRLVELFRMLRS